MRDAIAWSYDLLEPAQRTIFRQLAVFAGGFTLDAAGSVVGNPGDSGDDLLAGIEALAYQSLVHRLDSKGPRNSGAEPRFGMYETVREFASELLEASGEADVIRERHAAWCLTLVTQWDPLGPEAWHGDWIERADAELPNARAALGWLVGSGQAESALRMASGLHHPWWTRSRLSEAVDWFERVLASGAGTSRSRALALVSFTGGW